MIKTAASRPTRPRNIAVIGSGIAGLSAAWLLSHAHRVTVYERDGRIGGHSNTVDVEGRDGAVAVDTGFIVYNEVNYPNLVRLFDHLGVATKPSDMSFAVSIDDGDLEYSGTSLGGLFAQTRNVARPRFWRIFRDIIRFYREAPKLLAKPGAAVVTLGEYLDREGYSRAFLYDHLLPMAAAIWSTPAEDMRDYPAVAFIRFCETHGLLRLSGRPQWRTVEGGSREYVRRLTQSFADRIEMGAGVASVRRCSGGVVVRDRRNVSRPFDHVVIAAHADDALAMLSDSTAREREILGAFKYQKNLAVLHRDSALMPRRRKVWSSWNYLGQASAGRAEVCVTYWMNRLQSIDPCNPLFVTLNPIRMPEEGCVVRSYDYDHPVFDTAAIRAQDRLWDIQGNGNTWFCGSYFGAGFHEDALQAGLAVAEALGGIERPWRVPDRNSRIPVPFTLEAA